jgi:hypothetical protein
MKKPRKIHPPRPPKPPDYPQNPRTPKLPGKNDWVRAHWRWDYTNQQWEWVIGHWRK